MDLKKSILNAKKNISEFINKKWAEWKAQESREATRKQLEREAFRKAYESERIKLKAIEGRIKAKSEIFPTQGAVEPGKGTIPQPNGANVPIDKTALETRHPVTMPETAKKVMEYISH